MAQETAGTASRAQEPRPDTGAGHGASIADCVRWARANPVGTGPGGCCTAPHRPRRAARRMHHARPAALDTIPARRPTRDRRHCRPCRPEGPGAAGQARQVRVMDASIPTQPHGTAPNLFQPENRRHRTVILPDVRRHRIRVARLPRATVVQALQYSRLLPGLTAGRTTQPGHAAASHLHACRAGGMRAGRAAFVAAPGLQHQAQLLSGLPVGPSGPAGRTPAYPVPAARACRMHLQHAMHLRHVPAACAGGHGVFGPLAILHRANAHAVPTSRQS